MENEAIVPKDSGEKSESYGTAAQDDGPKESQTGSDGGRLRSLFRGMTWDDRLTVLQFSLSSFIFGAVFSLMAPFFPNVVGIRAVTFVSSE